jgi:integrase
MWRLQRKLGIRAAAYGLRHTFATDALARGVPDAQVAALLRHSGTTMLHKHYSRLTAQSQALREALGRVR